jgi:hypothetical protein
MPGLNISNENMKICREHMHTLISSNTCIFAGAHVERRTDERHQLRTLASNYGTHPRVVTTHVSVPVKGLREIALNRRMG